MDHKLLIDKLYQRIKSRDLEGILQCFTPDGTIDSPRYGKGSCREYFKQILNDSSKIETEVHEVYESEKESNSVAVLLTIEVTLNDSNTIKAKGMNHFVFNGDLIESIRFYYDTMKANEDMAS